MVIKMISIDKVEEKFNQLAKIFNIKDLSKQLIEIDNDLAKPDIWLNPNRAKTLSQKRNDVSSDIETFSNIKTNVEYFKEFLQFASEVEKEEIYKELESISDNIDDIQIKKSLNGKEDSANCILTIHAGSGGTEAKSWANMLLRMYTRWANFKGFSCEILDIQYSDEDSSNCIDFVTIQVSGKNAYGFLKNENGIHRLVRNSPYNAAGKRQTSFAAISVEPDVDDIIEITINDKDLVISAMTAGGAGGQNQNRIKSAIRIQHIPTGINVVSRTSRDQLQNKKNAFAILKSKLYQLELAKQQNKYQEFLDNQKQISWGSQIRSYVEQPQQRVTDHRTDIQITNFYDVLDGNLDIFIRSSLLLNIDVNVKKIT